MHIKILIENPITSSSWTLPWFGWFLILQWSYNWMWKIASVTPQIFYSSTACVWLKHILLIFHWSKKVASWFPINYYCVRQLLNQYKYLISFRIILWICFYLDEYIYYIYIYIYIVFHFNIYLLVAAAMKRKFWHYSIKCLSCSFMASSLDYKKLKAHLQTTHKSKKNEQLEYF